MTQLARVFEPYVPFSENGPFAKYLFFVDRKVLNVENVIVENGKISYSGNNKSGLKVRNEVEYFGVDIKDFSAMTVYLNRGFNARYRIVPVEYVQFFSDDNTNYGNISFRYSLASSFLRKIERSEDMFRRILPNTFIDSKHDVDYLFDGINRVLNLNMRKNVLTYLKTTEGYDVSKGLRISTVGQYLMYLFIKQKRLSSMDEEFTSTTGNLRYVLLSLLRIQSIINRGPYTSDKNAAMVSILNSLYDWIVLGTCTSCFEKILLNETSRPLYSYDNYPTKDRAMWFEMYAYDYILLDHGEASPSSKLTLQTFEHSGIRMTHLNSRSNVYFRDVLGTVKAINMPFRSCLLLFNALNIIWRSRRAKKMGSNFDLLKKWIAEEIASETIENMLLDLAYLVNLDLPFERLIINIICIIIEGYIPMFLLNGTDSYEDDYDEVIVRMMNYTNSTSNSLIWGMYNERFSDHSVKAAISFLF